MAFYFLVTFSLGIISGYYIDVSYIMFATAIFLLSLIIKIFIFKIKTKYLIILFLPIIYFIGAYYITIFCDSTLKPEYRFINKEIVYECTVNDIPLINKDKTIFNAKIDRIFLKGKSYEGKSNIYITLDDVNKDIEYKHKLRIKSYLNIPNGPMNRGDFNYATYLKTKKIFFTSYVEKEHMKIIYKNKRITGIKDLALFLRKSIQYNIESFYNGEEGQLLKSIILGDRSGFTEIMNDSISKSGLMHITAVSGMHTAILLMGIFSILKVIRANKTVSNCIAIFCLILFMFITGLAPSVLRSGIMLIIYLVGDIFNKEKDTLNFLFVSALIILFANPAIIFSAGFQLSFFATFSILIYAKHLYKFLYSFIKVSILKYPLTLLTVSFSAMIGTVPFLAYHFNTFSPISILSNLLVLPIVPFILIGGIMFSSLFNTLGYIADLIGYFLFALLKYILYVAKFFSKDMLLNISVKSPGVCWVLIYILICILLLILIDNKIPRTKIYVVTISIIILITSAVNIYLSLYNQYFPVVSFINVDQGDSILIQYKGKNLLIDGGGMYSYDVGEKILYPYLIKRGIKKIDIVFISHFDSDHVKGIISIMDKVQINKIFASNSVKQKNEIVRLFLKKAEENNINVDILGSGDKIKIDRYFTMHVLSPQRNKNFYDQNNSSLVLKMLYGDASFLFTGDIEELGQEYLINRGQEISSNVLKIPHHGAIADNTLEFVTNVKPQYAVISVGRNNFGHPSKKLLDFLYYNDIIVFRTDLNGEITFKIDKKGIADIKYLKGFVYEY